jgi:hypothetical protein
MRNVNSVLMLPSENREEAAREIIRQMPSAVVNQLLAEINMIRDVSPLFRSLFRIDNPNWDSGYDYLSFLSVLAFERLREISAS